MRLRELFRYEIGTQLRHLSTWMYMGLLFTFSLLLGGTADPLISSLNAPVNVANWTLLIGLMGILITAALFVEAGHREIRWRMEALVQTTPLRKREYLGGRFLGALAINVSLLLAVPAGLLLSTQLPAVDPGRLGSLYAPAYVFPYLFLLLPNVLFNGALLFGITILSRRSLPAYLGALGLMGAYLLTLNLSVGLESSPVLALLDPSGGVTLMAITDGWTPVEQNTRLVPIGGILLWNRIFWTSVALAFLAYTFRRFHFGHPEPHSRRGSAPKPNGAPVQPLPGAGAVKDVAIPAVCRTFGAGTQAHQLLAVLRLASRQIVRSREFYLIVAGFFLLGLIVLSESLTDPMFGAPEWPVTSTIVAILSSQTIGMLMALVTVFYAGELVWRDREAGIEKIADSLPVPDWVAYLGNFLALCWLLVVLQFALMLSGMLLQTLRGYYSLEPRVYLHALFGFALVDYVLFAVLAVLVHVLLDKKYLAHVAAMLAFMIILQASRFGIEHKLLIYGADPGWAYSDLTGFEPFLKPFAWFKLYWASWALLLGLVTLLLWVRGPQRPLRERARLALQRLSPRLTAMAGLGLLLVLTTGGFIFYNTDVLNDYRPARESAEIRAEYERRYKEFENIPQPWLTAVRLQTDLYPESRELVILGSYTLVNRTDVVIDSVHLSSFPYSEIRLGDIRFDRPTERALEDPEHGYRIFRLGAPLVPGDSLRMEFQVSFGRRGFENREVGSVANSVRGDATYVQMFRLLPGIGYQRDLMELSDPAVRGEQGLQPQGYFPAIDDARAIRVPRSSPNADWIDFEATVATAADQIAVMPGTLQRSWLNGSSRYFHYKAQAPIMNSLALMSARYAVHEEMAGDVQIRILHHPDHAFGVERAAQAVRRSLDYYSREFGPYPYSHFTMVEVPASGNFARAYPGQLVYTENNPIAIGRTDESATSVDTRFLIIAHEVAHQWWGHQLMPADVEGSQLLSESLAQYSAIMVFERTYGAEAARRFLRSMHLSYLSGRGKHTTPEVPLLRTGDHVYIHYRKGAVAMYALQDYLGEERVNRGLRTFVDQHRYQGPPYPTTHDLYRELQTTAPDSLSYLLEDLLATITLWDLRAISARAQPLGGGGFRVTLSVEAAKVRSDSIGNDAEVPMADLVEVGVFSRNGEPLYLEKHRVSSGTQSITVDIAGTPHTAGIDPYHKLITRHRDGLIDAKIASVELQSDA